MNNKLLLKLRKYLIITTFIVVFIYTMIINIPTWLLAREVAVYSDNHAMLYNLSGTFWDGSGLLVFGNGGKNAQTQTTSPVAYVNWHIKLGFKKYVNIVLSTGSNEIANIYIDKNGINIDNVNLSLSVIQMTQLVDVVKDLGISGDFHIDASHILLSKKTEGQLNINIRNVSSGLSPINPLGNYTMNLDVQTGAIHVNSSPGSLLMLSGDGSTTALTLSAKIDPSKAEEMKTFITLMGIPKPDGSHELKLF